MSKKRRVPPQVAELLARKQQLAATFAERQSAALGKPAREQLKPLLESEQSTAAMTPARPKLTLPDFGTVSVRLAETFQAQMLQSLAAMQPRWAIPTGTISFGLATPTIDEAKLEALKAATPYKVEAQVPDMVHVITGWRGWSLGRSGRLEALGQSCIWPAKQALEAGCSSSQGHLAPAWSCQCGIWAFKDIDRLVAAIGSSYAGCKVLGSVSLWGRVIETENGYRAQYAYPSELWLLDPSLEELGLIYDVPVRRVL